MSPGEPACSAASAYASARASAVRRCDADQSACQRTRRPTASRSVPSWDHGTGQTVSARGIRARSSVGERCTLLEGAGEPATDRQHRRDLVEERSLVGEREQGLEEQHDVERPGWQRRHPADRDAGPGPPELAARACQRHGGGIGIHPEVGARQLGHEERPRPAGTAAEVEDRHPRPDAGGPGQGADLARRHQALLAHELARWEGGPAHRVVRVEGSRRRSLTRHRWPPVSSPVWPLEC